MQILARFRCSSHYLQVETDRKCGIERCLRFCQLCDLNQIEDEFHFLLFCPYFNELRMKYIPRIYFDPPTIESFLALLTSHSTDMINRLAVFVFHTMKLRKEIYEIV